jgi:hypothetical protein
VWAPQNSTGPRGRWVWVGLGILAQAVVLFCSLFSDFIFLFNSSNLNFKFNQTKTPRLNFPIKFTNKEKPQHDANIFYVYLFLSITLLM